MIRAEAEETNGSTSVTKIWCRVCERNKDAILIHPTCKGPAKKAMMTFVNGTINVQGCLSQPSYLQLKICKGERYVLVDFSGSAIMDT